MILTSTAIINSIPAPTEQERETQAEAIGGAISRQRELHVGHERKQPHRVDDVHNVNMWFSYDNHINQCRALGTFGHRCPREMAFVWL
jgi:hypothetical protein